MFATAMSPEGIHYLLWDGACRRPRQAARLLCRIPFIWGMRLPERCSVWWPGWRVTPSPAVWAPCCNVHNLCWEKEKGEKKIQNDVQSNCTKLHEGEEMKRIRRAHTKSVAQSAIGWMGTLRDSPPYGDFHPTPTHWYNFSKVSAKAIYTFSSSLTYPNTKPLCWCEKQNSHSRRRRKKNLI